MKKINKSNNRNYIIIIILLLLFSYYEIKNDFRLGGALRDLLYAPIKRDNNDLSTFINIELKKETEELKSLLDIDYSLTDFDMINATIVERNNTYWLNEMTINKGEKDGILKDQAVITKNGLIGKVISTSYNSSKIKLITGFDSPIQVDVNGKIKLLTINNYCLYIKGINKEDNIKEGDKVLTSGLSNFFPKGIIIGQIKNINKESDDIGYFAEVELSSDLSNLRFVTVLKRHIQ